MRTDWMSGLVSVYDFPWKPEKGTFTLFPSSKSTVCFILAERVWELVLTHVPSPTALSHCRATEGVLMPNSSWTHCAHISPEELACLQVPPYSATLVPWKDRRRSSEFGTGLWEMVRASTGGSVGKVSDIKSLSRAVGEPQPGLATRIQLWTWLCTGQGGSWAIRQGY